MQQRDNSRRCTQENQGRTHHWDQPDETDNSDSPDAQAVGAVDHTNNPIEELADSVVGVEGQSVELVSEWLSDHVLPDQPRQPVGCEADQDEGGDHSDSQSSDPAGGVSVEDRFAWRTASDTARARSTIVPPLTIV